MKYGREILRSLALITQLGISMMVPIVGCILLGSFLDRKLGTGVVFLSIFTVLGVMTAFKTLYDLAARQFKGK